jgi:hypothetical protein
MINLKGHDHLINQLLELSENSDLKIFNKQIIACSISFKEINIIKDLILHVGNLSHQHLN